MRLKLTRYAPTEDGLLVCVVAVPHGDAGGVRNRSPDVCSVYQVPELLHPESGRSLPHGKAQGIHHIGLPWCDLIHEYI